MLVVAASIAHCDVLGPQQKAKSCRSYAVPSLQLNTMGDGSLFPPQMTPPPPVQLNPGAVKHSPVGQPIWLQQEVVLPSAAGGSDRHWYAGPDGRFVPLQMAGVHAPFPGQLPPPVQPLQQYALAPFAPGWPESHWPTEMVPNISFGEMKSFPVHSNSNRPGQSGASATRLQAPGCDGALDLELHASGTTRRQTVKETIEE
jgi:hypothetical protein